MESLFSVILDKLLQWIFSESGKVNSIRYIRMKLQWNWNVVTVHSETEGARVPRNREMRVAVFDSQLLLRHNFLSQTLPSFYCPKSCFFSIYLCTYIDDKKPYKPFNQLDTSSRHTASPSPVNKELHFFFGKFIIFVEIQNRLFFRLRTHLKINRTIIGTMIWWSVNPYYTLLPPHKKKISITCHLPIWALVYFNSKSVRSQKRSMVFKPLRCVSRQRKENTKHRLFCGSQIIW